MRTVFSTTRSRSDRQGFTLTEMLVATALVVLIMLMFAQIYGSAVGSIREQRGLGNNDQKARIIETTLRNDLQSMTYRQPDAPYGNVQGIVPMTSGDELIIDPTHQRGYFHFDENTSLDQDDIIQFTIQVRGNQRGDIQDRLKANRLVGKAQNLSGSNANDNEPERDDGIDGNNQGSSSAAEVCYFLRGGNLYRRVLLLREPLTRAVPVNSQPTQNLAQTRMFQSSGGTIGANYNVGSSSFYRDFDYAATRVNGSLWFHSVDSLANNVGERNVPIALPKYRFGFDITQNYRSVDRDSSSPSTQYIGRFTLRECADSRFNWPGNGSNNPYTRTDLTLNTSNFSITQLDQTNRIAEDILLTNVEAFDVQLFNPNPAADDNDASTDNDQVFYSPPLTPSPGANSPIFNATTFDTWHPDASGSGPSRILKVAQADVGVRNTGNNNAALSSLPLYLGVPALNPTSFTAGSFNNISYIYRLTSDTSGGGTTGDTVPEFPPVLGNIVIDKDATWECIDNRIPLKAIQITIRFRDVGSSLPRQVTIVHSFVE